MPGEEFQEEQGRTLPPEDLGEVVDAAPGEGEYTPEQQAEDEALARRMGWRPKEEFKGDPDKWKPAREFVQFGMSELPVLRNRVKQMSRNFDRMESDLKETKTRLKESGEVLRELNERSKKADQRAHERVRNEIKERMRKAASESDTTGYDQAERELEALDAERREPEAPARREPDPAPARRTPKPEDPPEISQEVLDWIDDNPWFRTDRVRNAYATEQHELLLKEHPEYNMTENLAEVKKRTIRAFPERFGNPARRRATPVAEEGERPPPRKPNAKSYENLPADAKAACDKFVRTIPGYTREQYVEEYYKGE